MQKSVINGEKYNPRNIFLSVTQTAVKCERRIEAQAETSLAMRGAPHPCVRAGRGATLD